MFKWYKTIKEVLKDEPETWLNYLTGQQYNNLAHINQYVPNYSGLPIQLVKFFYFLSKKWRPLRSSTQNGLNYDFFVYGGTNNQIVALNTTLDALRKRNFRVLAIAPKKHLINEFRKNNYQTSNLTTKDIFKILFLLSIRFPNLYHQLKTVHPDAISYRLGEFCWVYVYLVYFDRVLSTSRPKFVITANDHNIANRCLIATAHQLGIETVYIQHASVSKIFPALRFNYAFLDGQNAFDIYYQCERNLPRSLHKRPRPQVFLSGQKKSLDIKANANKCSLHNSIGIAINRLDKIEEVLSFVTRISLTNWNVIIRWHPSQPLKDKTKISQFSSKLCNITISDPIKEDINIFLSQIKWLVAGNSSIHLEAALANVIPIYYEFSKSDNPDYYGYVKKGLAKNALNVEDVIDYIGNSNLVKINNDSLRYFSATYDTRWDGKEGELVAECLYSIVYDKPNPIHPISF